MPIHRHRVLGGSRQAAPTLTIGPGGARIAVCALGDLRGRGDSAGAIAPSGEVHDEIERRAPHAPQRRRRIAHEHHGLDAPGASSGLFA